MNLGYDDLTVVLPTLNEEKSIAILIGNIVKEYKGISILVMDDGSKDKTKSVVQKLSAKNKRIRFVDRAAGKKQRGLTASAVDGILSSRTRYVVVMDADLQHPTRIIGDMKKKLSAGDDLVVAVREDVSGWELHRKIISKTLIMIGYFLLAITDRSRCKDIFSGFFGVDRNIFASTYSKNSARFVSGGYKILFDFLKCTKNGSIKIGQVPYSFGTRKYGASKAGFKQGMLLFKSFVT